MGSAIATPYAVMAHSAVGNEGPSLAALWSAAAAVFFFGGPTAVFWIYKPR